MEEEKLELSVDGRIKFVRYLQYLIIMISIFFIISFVFGGGEPILIMLLIINIFIYITANNYIRNKRND